MNPSPTLIPLTAGTPPPEWWQILADLCPWVLFLAACIAGFIWWLALRQEAQDASRREWWSRAQWALEATWDENPQKQRAGRAVLKALRSRVPVDSDEAQFAANAQQVSSGRDGETTDLSDKPD